MLLDILPERRWVTMSAALESASMDTLQGVIVWLLFGAVVAGVLINAASLFLSPRAWSRWPSWLRGKGQFAERRYSDGWSAWPIRIAGAILVGAMLWIVYEALVRR